MATLFFLCCRMLRHKIHRRSEVIHSVECVLESRSRWCCRWRWERWGLWGNWWGPPGSASSATLEQNPKGGRGNVCVMGCFWTLFVRGYANATTLIAWYCDAVLWKQSDTCWRTHMHVSILLLHLHFYRPSGVRRAARTFSDVQIHSPPKRLFVFISQPVICTQPSQFSKPILPVLQCLGQSDLLWFVRRQKFLFLCGCAV